MTTAQGADAGYYKGSQAQPLPQMQLQKGCGFCRNTELRIQQVQRRNFLHRELHRNSSASGSTVSVKLPIATTRIVLHSQNTQCSNRTEAHSA